MATTGLAIDERFQLHRTGAEHPECPQRLAAITHALDQKNLIQSCKTIKVSPVDMLLVTKVHEQSYIDRIEQACQNSQSFIDVPDCAISPESFQIAQLATGTLINAVNDVIAGHVDNAFCAVRPPGHHAERHLSMGFCLFNHVAIAAQYLIDHHGLSRVLILDWDVHHGNGTQHIFEADPRVFFISLHGHPGVVYPGTGHEHEQGRGEGEGFTMNLPMLPPSSDVEWQRAYDKKILPAIEKFDPQFVLISAGFDAHQLDPLAPLELTTEVFGWMTDQLLHVAQKHCDGKLVSTLEGGYHFDALAESTTLHVEKLLNT